jgi:hypothetical protein
LGKQCQERRGLEHSWCGKKPRQRANIENAPDTEEVAKTRRKRRKDNMQESKDESSPAVKIRKCNVF